MKEEFKTESWRDFKARYEGTFGWYEKEDGDTLLVKLTAVGDNVLHFTDKNGSPYTAYPDKGNQFQFLPVEKAVYNTPSDVVYCRRTPARQWRRGLCAGNTYIASLVSGKQLGVDFALLEQIFNPDPNLAHPVEFFKHKLEGKLALNHTFAIINDKVLCYDTRIGTYKKGTITLNTALFKQEIEDLIRQHEIPARCEVAA